MNFDRSALIAVKQDMLRHRQLGIELPMSQNNIINLIDDWLDMDAHLDTFCRCPSHGPSLIQMPKADLEDYEGRN